MAREGGPTKAPLIPFLLVVPFKFPYTNSMKNKNTITNRTVSELVDLICELQTKKGNGDFKHSYALGTVQAILDWHVKGYTTDLQGTINDSYNNVKKEMDTFEPLTAVTDYPTD